jgi:hypothetical protein
VWFCVCWWSGLGIPSSSQQSPWRLARLKPLLISRGWSLIFRRDTHHRAYFTAASPSLSLSLSHIQSNNAARSRASQSAPRLSERVFSRNHHSKPCYGAREREREREKRWRATSSSYFLLQPRSAKSRDLETNSLFHAFLMSDAAEWALGTRGNFPAAVCVCRVRDDTAAILENVPLAGVSQDQSLLYFVSPNGFYALFSPLRPVQWWIMNECFERRFDIKMKLLIGPMVMKLQLDKWSIHFRNSMRGK